MSSGSMACRYHELVESDAHRRLSVLIVDDNPMLCAGMERWLSREPGVAAVACITDWRMAVSEARRLGADVILLDIDLPGANGLDLVRPLMAAVPSAKVLMLSGLAHRRFVEQALDLGAAGYLVKDQEAKEIGALLRRAAMGEIVLCPASEAALAGPAPEPRVPGSS